jgi:hypothetical protein
MRFTSPTLTARHRIALLLSLLLQAAGAAAEEEPSRWSVTPTLGVFQPSLKQLNEGVFRAPYEGTGTVTNALGGGDDLVVSYVSPLPALNPGTLAGLDFQWRVDDKNGFFMGVSDWQATSFTSSVGTMPIQGVVSQVAAQRKANLSFREYHLGWRHTVYDKPKKYNLYATGSLHQVYDVDYQESFSMVFLSGPPQSFRKSIVVSGHGTGGFLLQGGLGGEWHITDSIAVGVEGDYALDLKKVLLLNGKASNDILDTDNLTMNKTPIVVDSNNALTYKSEAGGTYKDLALDFGGWKVMLKATLYY